MKRTIITSKDNHRRYLNDLWDYRELLLFFVWRDILVRYKQTVVGIAWSLIRPLLMVLAFTFIFSKLAKLPSGGIPYPIVVFSALLPWQFFATALSDSSNSLITNANLVSKIYFPRIIVPLSSIVVCLVDFLISLLILGVIMVVYRFTPSYHMLALPLFLFLAIVMALAVGLWFSALNVKYRDFRYVVPFIVQFGLYISPVGFNSSVVPEKWRMIYSLNPMVGVIDGFRWSIIGEGSGIFAPGLVVSVLMTTIIFASGLWFFLKTEKTFADII